MEFLNPIENKSLVNVFNPFLGSFNVEPEQYQQFFDELDKSYKENKTEHFAEKQRDISGIMLDFDCFQSLAEPQIENKHIENLVVKICSIINREFAFNDFDEYHVAVIRRPLVVDLTNPTKKILQYSKKHHAYKDGIHILIPEIMITKEQKKYLNELINDEITFAHNEIFDDCVFTNKKHDSILDMASSHVPIFFLGSIKPSPEKREPYPLSFVYKIDTDQDEGDPLTYSKIPIKKMSRYNVSLEFSVSNWGIEKMLADKRQRDFSDDSKFSEWKKIKLEKENEKMEKDEKYRPSNEEIYNVHSNKVKIVEIIKTILMNLDVSRSVETRHWYCIMKVCINLSHIYCIDLIDAFDEFSKRAGDKYIGSREEIINKFNDIDGKGYLGLLWHFLKNDEPAIFKQCMRDYFKLVPPPKKELFYHNIRDFAKMGDDINVNELIEWMKETCIVCIQRGRSMLFTKNLELDGSVSYEPQENLNIGEIKWMGTVKDGENEKQVPMSSNKIFQNNVLWKYSYDYFNFVPFLKLEQQQKISPRLFNTFSGFRWKYTPSSMDPSNKMNDSIPVPPESIKPWIDHLINTLCPNSQLRGCKYNNLGHAVLQWYAHIFQNPTIKPWAIVFMSEEGIGKGIWQTFFEQVLTKSLCSTFTSWDQITGSFNGQMAGKLLFTLNEATNYPTNTQKELMKTMIKDVGLSINKKFVNQYDVDNFARIQITTNNKRPISIDYDDRRYCCIKSDNSNRGNAEYFKPLIASMNDSSVQKDMFDYLCNYPLDGFDSEKPPMTEWKQELIGQNLNTVIEFLKYLWDDYDEQEMTIKADAMFLGYKEWSNNSGEHASGSNRAFYAELKKWGVVKTKVNIDGCRVHGFHMKKNDIVELLRKVLGNADFEL